MFIKLLCDFDSKMFFSFEITGTKLFVVDSFLGGNRLRAGQLSEDKKNYYREFNLIKDKANLFDFVKCFFYWVMENFAGKPIKRRLSKNRVSYKTAGWELK